MSMPAANNKGGDSLALPDVCFLPAPPPPAGPGGIPTPYPNTTHSSTTDKMTQKVLLKAKTTMVHTSKIPGSGGEDSPTPKGLISKPPKGKVLMDANMVDVRAANGNVGAKTLQGQTIQSVKVNMGTDVGSATEAVLHGKSSIPKVAGDEQGGQQSVHSSSVMQRFKKPRVIFKDPFMDDVKCAMHENKVLQDTESESQKSQGSAAQKTQSSQSGKTESSESGKT